MQAKKQNSANFLMEKEKDSEEKTEAQRAESNCVENNSASRTGP